MEYYFLDRVPWQDSQAIYHAAADLQREALFILRPAAPYVCLGFHQDAKMEIDLDFTEREAIPVFRREVGGGAVYLDEGQLFYQLVLRRDNPQVPASKSEYFRKFLLPVVETYRAIGVQAEYKPVNDILAHDRKISGNGAAEIGESVVLVGNFILDFNYDMMAKVLRVPDEKFRDKVNKTLRENLSTIRNETGNVPNTADLAKDLVRRYESILGSMTEHEQIDRELKSRAAERIALMDTQEWLFSNDRRHPDLWNLKIRDGVQVIQKVYKAPGGLIRISAVARDGELRDVHISGDFFFYPSESLVEFERSLEGASTEPERLTQTIDDFFARHEIEAPGITPADFVRAFA
jgi:lipoate---protein ligase